MKPKFLPTLFFVLFSLVIVAVAQDAVQTAAGPEPAPWWMRVEEFQSFALKWLTAISIVGGAVVAAALGLWAKLTSGIKEIRERQDRAKEDSRQMQAQITDVAKSLPAAPPPAVVVTPLPRTPDGPIGS